ncbi:MAG: tripartite tricarboxylate transporter substrate binding protein, partial [Gammaproteobacteria bacterium]|nr:tripartite tricarboxylate transporter substrate binding protein [Gammaproteobacteria bacterium]
MKIKKIIWAGVGCAALLLPAAHAQNAYPQKPVDVIVPWGAGGGADVMARILAKWLESDLKVSFPVLNVPGASGMIGLGKMVSLPADGQTIAVLTGDSLMMAATPKATFNLSDSLALAVLLRQPSGIFAPKNSRFKTWEDVVKNSDKEQVTLGITGPNTADDLTARYLKTRGVALTGIPYTKPGERYSAVIGGHVDLLYEQAGDVRSFLESGDLRPLIFFSPKRLPPPFADVPV